MATADPTENTDAQWQREIDVALREDLTENWFPRANDAHGGYTENFDRRWHPSGDKARHLIHQARLAWTAAAYALHNPDLRDEFAQHAMHGIRFIDTVFRDREYGGFYYEVGIDGRPLRDGEKHTYAIAFAIFAAAMTFSVTREERALAVARDGFAWLRAHSRQEDRVYIEDLTQTGLPIIGRKRRNPLGYEYGDATSNTHLHLLEAFAELYRVDPGSEIQAALESVFLMVRDRFVTADGRLLHRLEDNAVFASHGHAVETAYLLIDAADALGMPDDPNTWSIATRLADHVLSHGRDTRFGGLFNEPDRDGKVKIGWVQAEALNTWITMCRHHRGADKWSSAFVDQWQFIRDHLIDLRYGGWIWQTTRRGRASGITSKSGEWQDPYHTSRALMNATNAVPFVNFMHGQR